MVDVTPDIKWLSENKYKNLKVVVEIDNSINAQRASEIEFRRRYKSLGSLRIIADRGLQVILDLYKFSDKPLFCDMHVNQYHSDANVET